MKTILTFIILVLTVFFQVEFAQSKVTIEPQRTYNQEIDQDQDEIILTLETLQNEIRKKIEDGLISKTMTDVELSRKKEDYEKLKDLLPRLKEKNRKMKELVQKIKDHQMYIDTIATSSVLIPADLYKRY